MKPMTLFLLDPSSNDLAAGLAEGRVAAVFTCSQSRQAARNAFPAEARGGQLIDLDAECLKPFARPRGRAPLPGDQGRHELVDAALAFIGVPRTVVAVSDDLFGVVADALRQEARRPRSFRFKGWPEGRRQDLARLGYDNVALIGPPSAADVAGPDGAAAAGRAAGNGRTAADPFEGCTFHAWR